VNALQADVSYYMSVVYLSEDPENQKKEKQLCADYKIVFVAKKRLRYFYMHLPKYC